MYPSITLDERRQSRNYDFIFLINSFTSLSGGDIWALEVCRKLVERGYKVAIVTSMKGVLSLRKVLGNSYNRIDFIISSQDKYYKGNGILNLLLIYIERTLRALLLDLEKRGRILIASSQFLPDTLPVLLKRNVLKVMVLHMVPPSIKYGYRGHFLKKKISKENRFRILLYTLNHIISMLLFKNLGSLILVLPSTYVEAIRYGIEKQRICIIVNGSKIMEKAINNVLRDTKDKEYDACYIGRAHIQKGLEDLIRAWKIVTKFYPRAKLIMVGHGISRYKDLIDKLGLSKNILTKDFVTEDEKYKIIRKSRILILPSYYESFSITLLEALTQGTPVIAYNLPVYRLIYNDVIITVEIGNVLELSKSILRLLLDESEYVRAIYKALEFVKTKGFIFTWDSVVKMFLRCLEDVIHSKNVKERKACYDRY